MSDKKENKEVVGNEKIKESAKGLKEMLTGFLTNNDYRSDLIITVILVVTMYIYSSPVDMTDKAFSEIMRLGMVLVALEYLGEKIIDRFL